MTICTFTLARSREKDKICSPNCLSISEPFCARCTSSWALLSTVRLARFTFGFAAEGEATGERVGEKFTGGGVNNDALDDPEVGGEVKGPEGLGANDKVELEEVDEVATDETARDKVDAET